MTKTVALTQADIDNAGVPADQVADFKANFDLYVKGWQEGIDSLDNSPFTELVAKSEKDPALDKEIGDAWDAIGFLSALRGINLGGDFQIAFASNVLRGSPIDHAITTALCALQVFFDKRDEAEGHAEALAA
jgi:hypothetical protein